MKKRTFASIMICLSLLALSVPASAQEGSQPPPAQKKTVEVTEERLDKAVNAYVQIIKINENLQKQLQAAEGKEQRLELQESANDQMLEAIKGSGLEVQTYNSIMQQMNTDKELSEKFNQKIKKKMNDGKEE
ncbi:MAG: DUF4168 domain-containing protein [Chitinispirillaceae bacterium]